MLFALFVLNSDVGSRELIFDVAAFTILASIIAHGLTDTVGAGWIRRRAGGRADEPPAGPLGEARGMRLSALTRRSKLRGGRRPRGAPRPSRSRRCGAPCPSCLGLGAEREADELRQVQDGEAEVAVDDLGRLGLLHVEVEVAERAGGDEAVGAGVERVADVGAGLAQRGLAFIVITGKPQHLRAPS